VRRYLLQIRQGGRAFYEWKELYQWLENQKAGPYVETHGPASIRSAFRYQGQRIHRSTRQKDSRQAQVEAERIYAEVVSNGRTGNVARKTIELLFGAYDYRRTLRAAAKKAGISEERRKHLSAHDIRHAAVTHAQEVSQNIAGAAYMAGHRRTATTAAYTHPGFAAGLAIQGARFGFRHTDGSRGNSEAQNPLVGTGGIEPPTPTVSRFSRPKLYRSGFIRHSRKTL
jgi:integrase